MKKTFKRIIDIKHWKKSTKTKALIVLVLAIVAIILAILRPAESELRAQVSPQMQELLDKDAQSDRKRVTITFNSLFVINYCSYSSSGKEAISERYVGFAGQIFKADEGAAKITGQMVNYTYRMLGCGENMMHGAKLTILLTTLTTVMGVILGTLLALGKMSKRKIISKPCSAYIFFFRGTPLLIQMFVIYFAIPPMFGFAWRDLFAGAEGGEDVLMGAFVAALISFSLNSGAYCAEIVRAAIQSIDKGQGEAARALGMNYAQTMTLVIIPQSVRRMIPPVCNEFIMVLKDVSLVFAISLMDITTISKVVMTTEGSYLVFIPALVIYLIITAFFTYIFDKVEKKFSIYE